MPAATSSNLPPPDYLPALEKQKELERQLAEQQVPTNCTAFAFIYSQIFANVSCLFVIGTIA